MIASHNHAGDESSPTSHEGVPTHGEAIARRKDEQGQGRPEVGRQGQGQGQAQGQGQTVLVDATAGRVRGAQAALALMAGAGVGAVDGFLLRRYGPAPRPAAPPIMRAVVDQRSTFAKSHTEARAALADGGQYSPHDTGLSGKAAARRRRQMDRGLIDPKMIKTEAP